MAIAQLQAESVCANPASLTVHTAALAFEALADDLEQLSALVHIASSATELVEQPQRKALRAIMVQLDGFAARANQEAAAYLDASRAAGRLVGA
jgi:hypothetical protein